MASCVWVGTLSTDWNTAGNWTGGVPTLNDDVSVAAVPVNTTINIVTTAAACKSADFTGAGANLLILTGNVNLSVYGSLTWQSGMTATAFTGSILIRGAGTVTSNNVNFGCAVFGDNGTASAITLALGSSVISCTNVSFAAATLTVSNNTATINSSNTANSTVALGGVNWNGTTFNFMITATKDFTLTGANTVANMSFAWTAENISNYVAFAANQVITDTLTLTGAETVIRPIFRSNTKGTARTLTAATVVLAGSAPKAMDFQDISGAGAGSWNLSASATGNCGGNTGITFRTPATYYLDSGTAHAGMTSNCWATSSGGGAGGLTVFPLPQDTIVIDDNSWDDTGNYFSSLSGHRFGNVDTSLLTEAQAFNFDNSNVIYGDLIFTGVSLTVGNTSTGITIDGRVKKEASDTLDINCLPAFGTTGPVTIDSYDGGTYGVRLLTNNLTHGGTFTLNRGTFDLNGKTLLTALWSNSNANTREYKDSAGGGKIVITGVTGTPFNQATTTGLTVSNAPAVDLGNSALTLTGNCTIAFGSKPATFGAINFKKHAGDFAYLPTGSGNTFGAITVEAQDATYQYNDITWEAGSTFNVASCVVGSATYPLDFKSSSAGTPAILVDTNGGTNVFTNVDIQDMTVSGAVWQALLSDGNSDVSGNTGWTWISGIGQLLADSAWKSITPYIFADGAWKSISGVQILADGAWKSVA